jgi:pimeloyl-ACP methyl ester carboxylesterase
MDAPLVLDPAGAPLPDPTAEPAGFVVQVEPADRIHFLDWGGPAGHGPGVLLVHGISQTAWTWAPVARRLAMARRTVALDLRGHGLSDAPTSGYDQATLVEDVIAVADGSGLLAEGPIVLAGHGLGAVVAAWTAAALADQAAGLVLVDGGWEVIRSSSGLEPDEFVRAIEEPPEVLRSMTAFLADREAFDPASWDSDQDRAARATVVETAAGHVVPATRPHALAGMVDALFSYDPVATLSSVEAPVVALIAAEDEAGSRHPALDGVHAALALAGRPPIGVARFPTIGHNLMRYRPAEVAASILTVDRRR